MDVGGNYVLVIVTVISSITALVSDNVWFAFDILFLWTMVSIRRFLPPLYHVFTRFVCCFARNNINPFFAPIGLLETITHFQTKTVFFFQLIAVRFWFCCFVYMCFLGRFWQFWCHETTKSLLFFSFPIKLSSRLIPFP